jgi:PHD/YefM family antitoxin component YafN of YafNO toxin-antitoxin module
MARRAAVALSSMVQKLPLTKARVHLGAIIKRVHLNKERFVLEKDGIPVAGLLDIDEFEDYLELQDPQVRGHIRKSNAEYLAGKSHPAETLLTELRKEKTPVSGKRSKTV